MVRITLPDAGERVLAAKYQTKYQTWLLSEDELSRALTETRHEAERALSPQAQELAGRPQHVARPAPGSSEPETDLGYQEARRRR